MKLMGKHSPPVEGVVANGHAPTLVPFTIPQLQVRQGGPVTPWPQPRKRDKAISAVRHVTAHRGWLAAIPVILVNAVAVIAQLTFLRSHLAWAPAGQALVAVTLESVAVYLAWQAHLAIIADDSAMRLRLAAYGFAAIVAVMNYSHYMAPGWRPTFPALVFALCSVISPWLWSIHSRRQSRDALKARGLIEPHAVRLGATRWMWHPWRSAKVMFHATWTGENDPAKAIAMLPVKVPEAAADDGQDDGQDDAGDPVTEDVSVPSEPVPPSPPDNDGSPSPSLPPVPPKTRQKTTPAITKATAAIKRHPGLSDAEIAKRASVSESTVRRARTAIGAP